MPGTTIASFVLRFVQDRPVDSTSSTRVWRGIIRHVQTGEESSFIRIDDALAFIGRYVDLDAAESTDPER